MKLDELTPAAYNPRKISVEAFQGLGKSIERFGLLMPIVWNKRTGNIVGGHQRFRYLKEKGETEVDVIVVDLDDQAEMTLNITLNNRAIRGDFTCDVVAMLETSEAQLGSSFNDVRLSDLFHDMTKRFAKELRDKNRSQEPTGPSSPPTPGPQGPTDDGVKEPDAVITCPQCKSRWRMKDNEIVFDSRTAGA
jgi:hypothetical protein